MNERPRTPSPNAREQAVEDMAAPTQGFPQSLLTIDWSKEDVIRLIEAYRERPELWDYNDSNYKVLSKKTDAWNEIAKMFGADIHEVRWKMNSVLASFRRARKKVVTATKQGDTDEGSSSWFGYEHLQFLVGRAVRFRRRRAKGRSEGDWRGIDCSDENDWITEAKTMDARADEDGTAETTIVCKIKSEMTRLGQNSVEEELLAPLSGRITPPPKRRHSADYMTADSKRISRDDECEIFGELIACQLRNLDYRTRFIAQHSINNVIFQAQMGLLADPSFLQLRVDEERTTRQEGDQWYDDCTTEKQERISEP